MSCIVALELTAVLTVGKK